MLRSAWKAPAIIEATLTGTTGYHLNDSLVGLLARTNDDDVGQAGNLHLKSDQRKLGTCSLQRWQVECSSGFFRLETTPAMTLREENWLESQR